MGFSPSIYFSSIIKYEYMHIHFKKRFIIVFCLHVCLCEGVSDPLELELQTFVCCHVGARN